MQSLFVRVFICGILALLGSLASAQEVQKLNLNDIPLQLRQTPLPRCGVSMAIDPRWDASTTRETRDDGTLHYEYLFKTREFWRERQAGPNGFLVEPTVHFTIECHAVDAKDQPGSVFLKVLAEKSVEYILKNDEYKMTASRVQTLTFPGVGEAKLYFLERRSPNRAISDTVQLLTLHDGKLIDVRLDLSRKPDGKFSKRVRPGQVFKFSGETGTMTVEATSKGRADPSGTLAYDRTKQENHAVFQKILGTLRGL